MTRVSVNYWAVSLCEIKRKQPVGTGQFPCPLCWSVSLLATSMHCGKTADVWSGE